MILVYDVSNQPTFDCCPEWLREIEEYASPKVLKVLVGKSEIHFTPPIPSEISRENARAKVFCWIFFFD